MRDKLFEHLYAQFVKSKLVHAFVMWQRGVPLKRKLPMLTLIEIIIPLILICILIYCSQVVIRNQSIEYTQDAMNLMKTDIDSYMDRAENVSQSIIYDEQLYEIMAEKNGGGAVNYYETYTKLNNLLKKYALLNNEIEVIYVISNSKEFYVCDNGNQRHLSTFLYDDLYAQAQKAQGRNVWYLADDGNQLQNIFIARIIYDRESLEEVGMLVLQVNREYFTRQCEELLNNKISNIVVADFSGKVIISNNQEYQLEDELNRLVANKEGTVIDHKQDMIISFVPTETGWEIISYTPIGILYKDIRILWISMSLIIVIMVLFLGIVSFTVIKDFLKPMDVLVNTMNEVNGEGDISPVPVDREDEIGKLSKHFNAMGERINNLIKWGYQESLTRKNAQLKSLQSQINPHFLFNTLEMINWKAQMSGVEEISDIVYALSVIMDASIGRDDKMISLREELEIVDQYMLIIKNRYGNRVIIKKEINLDTNHVFIPKLFIQPIVENSFSHGFKKVKKKDMAVMIRGYRNDQDIVIEVVDNGMGIPADKLARINDRLKNGNSSVCMDQEEHTSIGLDNVNHRIKLFYGEEYGVRIQSVEGCYTKVIVKFKDMIDEAGENFV